MTGKTILVVEDDADSRQALCTILEALGYSIIDFASGQETLDGLAGRPIDLAMLDVMMPGMNGYELLAALKQRPEYRDVPVILVTAKDENEEVLAGYGSGADYYITKPYTARQISYGLKIFLS